MPQKQGGDAAEEFLNDTGQRLQRHLMLTVAATFAAGIAAGALIGWVAKRGKNAGKGISRTKPNHDWHRRRKLMMTTTEHAKCAHLPCRCSAQRR